jgi:hypothetical protein
MNESVGVLSWMPALFYYLRPNKFENQLPIWLGEGNCQRNMDQTTRAMTNQGGVSLTVTTSTLSEATLVVTTLWSTLSTWESDTLGEILFVVPIVWELVLPACVLAATFGPPPVSIPNAPLLQLAVLVNTKSSSNKREDRPNEGFDKVDIFSLHNVD